MAKRRKKPAVKLKLVPARRVVMFKVKNHASYAAYFDSYLCEGTAPFTAYRRLAKAARRSGWGLQEIAADQARRLVRKRI